MSIPDIHTVNPYIRVAMRSVLKKGTVIKTRVIFDYELIYIEQGGMRFCYDGIDHSCQPGQFLLIRPGIPHCLDCTRQALSQPHIHFDLIYSSNSQKIPVSFKDRREMTPVEQALIQGDLLSGAPETPFLSFSDPERALSCFTRVIDCFTSGQGLLAKSALTELIAYIIRDNFPEAIQATAPSYDLARQLKDYIDSASGIRVSLDALEKQYSYNRFYLERIFKKKYGTGLIAYAGRTRMERAQKQLSVKTVSELSEELGYSSIYAFSRAFKHHFGVSPTEYKTRYL